MKKHPKKNNKGFTLLEVMLATAILSGTLVVLLSAYQLIGQSYFSASNHTKAMYLLEEKLHEVTVKPYKDRIAEGFFEEPFQRFRWRVVHGPLINNNVRKVDVLVSWDDRREDRRVSTSTLVRKGINAP